MTDMTARRALHLADLEPLAAALRTGGDAVFSAAETLVARTLGHKLFTVNLFDAARIEVARVHTSDPSAYPVGGRKPKAHTAWGAQVLTECRWFLAPDPEAVRAAFDDHATIFSLGIGAILNIPVCLDGRCVGTMNLCHQAGWYSEADVAPAQLIAAFLTAPLARM